MELEAEVDVAVDMATLDEKAVLCMILNELKQSNVRQRFMGRQMGQLLRMSPQQEPRVPYATWSVLCRQKVLFWYVDGLRTKEGLEIIFNGTRETTSRTLYTEVYEELEFEDKKPVVTGKARSVHGYLNTYVHNLSHRILYPLMGALLGFSGIF